MAAYSALAIVYQLPKQHSQHSGKSEDFSSYALIVIDISFVALRACNIKACPFCFLSLLLCLTIMHKNIIRPQGRGVDMHVVHEKHSTGRPSDVENFHHSEEQSMESTKSGPNGSQCEFNERHDGRCSVSIKPRYHRSFGIRTWRSLRVINSTSRCLDKSVLLPWGPDE
jgi:hypothetical protein